MCVQLTEVTGIKRPSKRKTQFDYYALPSKEVTLDDDSGICHSIVLPILKKYILLKVRKMTFCFFMKGMATL